MRKQTCIPLTQCEAAIFHTLKAKRDSFHSEGIDVFQENKYVRFFEVSSVLFLPKLWFIGILRVSKLPNLQSDLEMDTKYLWNKTFLPIS